MDIVPTVFCPVRPNLMNGASALALLIFFGATPTLAADVQWASSPASSDWNSGANWSTAAPPTPTDTAVFGATNNALPAISKSAATVQALQFNNGAPSYDILVTSGGLSGISASLTLTGSGIVNNSGTTQIINVGGTTGTSACPVCAAANIALKFQSQADAAGATIVLLPETNFVSADFSGTTGAAGNHVVHIDAIIDNHESSFGLSLPTIFLGSNQLVVGANNQTAAFVGAISDGGSAGGSGASLVKVGTGTLQLSGPLAYTGSTTIQGGTLAIEQDGFSGFVPMLFSGASTTINGGTLELGFTTQTQNGGVTLVSGTIKNGTLSSSGSFAVQSGEIDAAVTGSGSLIKTTAGTVILTSVNTYGGGTSVSAGVLKISGSGTLGSVTGAISVSGGTLDLGGTTQTQNGGVTLSGVIQNGAISSSGVFNLQGGILNAGLQGSGSALISGPVTLLAANTYTGGTTISPGTPVTIDDQTNSGAIPGSLVNNGSLIFARSGLFTFAGSISGTGPLMQNGSGTTILTGSSTYAGSTTVSTGTLSVNGSITSTVTVNSGGTLKGTGTVGATTIASGGTLAPGNSIGTITVNGNLTLASGSTFQAEVSPAAADRVNVSGAASIAGTLLLMPSAGAYTIGSRYTLISANGGLTGTFSTITENGAFSSNVRPRIAYDASSVTLVLDPNAITPFIPAGSGSNALAVGRAIDAVLQSGSAPSEFVALFNLPVSSLADSLERLAGQNESGAVQEGNESMRQFLSLVLDPFAGTRAEQRTAPGATSVWGGIYGGHTRLPGDAEAGSHSQTDDGGGLAIGLDYGEAPGTVAGLGVSIGRSDFRINQSFGSGHDDAYQFSIYGKTELDGFYLSAAGDYSIFDVRSSRVVSVSGATGAYSAAFTAHGFGGRAEAGMHELAGVAGLSPFAAVLAESMQMPAYAERTVSGSTTLAIESRSHSFDRLRSELGLDLIPALDLEPGLLHIRAGWAHEFNRTESVSAAFEPFPNQSFITTGAKLLDSGFVAAGVQLPISPNVTLNGSAEGDFGTTSSYGGSAELRVTW